MTQLPIGTVRYSIGVEFKNGMTHSMSDPFHTPCTIRDYIKNSADYLRGLKLRVVKYTLTRGEVLQGIEQTMWFCDGRTRQGIRRITI